MLRVLTLVCRLYQQPCHSCHFTPPVHSSIALTSLFPLTAQPFLPLQSTPFSSILPPLHLSSPVPPLCPRLASLLHLTAMHSCPSTQSSIAPVHLILF
ncbi:hypothetical protein VNO77_41873 [Canavalia gladiata]|uniref:Uncharacterized protein n=1 Tax=Canavalia gladiata TaxID=3824 RepID=A0AAN9PRX3_CANGL